MSLVAQGYSEYSHANNRKNPSMNMERGMDIFLAVGY